MKNWFNLKVGTKCPTCKQLLTDHALSHIHHLSSTTKKKIKEIEEQIETITNNSNKVRSDKIKKGKSKLDEYINEQSKLKDTVQNQCIEDKNKINERLKEVTSILTSMAEKEIKRTTKESYSKVEGLKNEQKNVTDRVSKIKDQIKERDKIRIIISRLENDIFVLNDRYVEKEDSKFDETMLKKLREDVTNYISVMSNLNNILPELKLKQKIYEFWKKQGFSSSGIPSMLIDDSIPFMNSKVAEYADQIAGGRYIISFDTLKPSKDGKQIKDKINVLVYDTKTRSDKRVKFSGGQTRLVDIATILTLRDLQSNFQDVKVNLLLFDEIFDALDDENIGYVSKLLKSLAKDLCIVIISHRHFETIESDEVLRIESWFYIY